ncbi:MAG: adenylate/guanylate cyclase domain-containing protein, partial [Acidobacteriota bacterium]|nr:adenylate/guanylate cyclase domain-containing protein [Acidobacteriota bacterium]
LYTFTWLVPRPEPAFHLLKDLEARTLDMRFRVRGPRKPDPRIVILAIDQKSQDLLGRWPFPRSVFADVLDFLGGAKARVVAFDINFPEPDQNSALEALRQIKKNYLAAEGSRRNPQFSAQLDGLEALADNDKNLAEAIARFGNAILGYFFLFDSREALSQNKRIAGEFLDYLSYQAYPQVIPYPQRALFEGWEAVGISPNLPRFAGNAKNFGFFNVMPDSDGTVRSEPVVIRFNNSYYPSLDIATVLAWTNQPLDKVAVVFNRSGLAHVDLGSVKVPTDSLGMVRINFHGPSGTYPTYSIADAVQRRLDPGLFRDHIVLVGPTATGIADTRPTPFESEGFPGVEVHANFIDNLLTGSFIQRGLRENFIDMLFIVLFSLPMGALVRALRPSRAALLLTVAAAAFLFFAHYQFSTEGVWLATFLPMSTLFSTYSAVVSYSYFFEEREKRLVRGAFQQYMAPEVIQQVLDRPELLCLGGEERELTAMFADIRGFTALSEGLKPAPLLELLNEYLTGMTAVIFNCRGTLDKYMGDAIMAFWGAPLAVPNHAEQACRAALGMSAALEELQNLWEKQGRPRIDIGIGINTGPMLVGNMGSKHRFNYTIIGDNVNVASRLEGVNKVFGTKVIISESTCESVRHSMVVRELDKIWVKGKKTPVTVYEVLAPIEQRVQYEDLISRFENALRFYRSGDWAGAMDLFEALLRDYPQDGPTRTFIGRCSGFILNPPQGKWDGVHAMTTK